MPMGKRPSSIVAGVIQTSPPICGDTLPRMAQLVCSLVLLLPLSPVPFLPVIEPSTVTLRFPAAVTSAPNAALLAPAAVAFCLAELPAMEVSAGVPAEPVPLAAVIKPVPVAAARVPEAGVPVSEEVKDDGAVEAPA